MVGMVYRESSKSTAALDTALAKAQGKFEKVVKNQTGAYGKFADLASMESATRAALASESLCVRQYFQPQSKGMLLVTELCHKGEFCVSAIPIPEYANPQLTVSYCTYMSRLAYARILCLAVEDDDGESLSGETPSAPPVAGPPSQDNRTATLLCRKASTAKTLDELDEAKQAAMKAELAGPHRQQFMAVYARREKELQEKGKPK
jgi:hypothetical protein